MSALSQRVIARCHLAYVLKGDSTRRAFAVCIHEPFLVEEGSVDFNISGWTSGCVISFDGLDEKEMTVHSADAIQAVELAVQDVEHYLRRLSKKYEFYFHDGDPYFED